MPRAGRRSASPTPRSSSGCGRSASPRAARRGLGRARRRHRGLRRRRRRAGSRSRPTCASPAGSTTTPAPSSRPAWPATSASARSAPAAATTRSPATADDLPRRRHLARRHPDCWCPLLAEGVLAGSRVGAVAPCWSRSPTRSAGAASDAVAERAARARHPGRGRARRAQKYGKQIRYAERRGIPFVWFPGRRRRRLRRGQGHPHRRPGRRPTRPPGRPPDEPTCARTIVDPSRPTPKETSP